MHSQAMIETVSKTFRASISFPLKLARRNVSSFPIPTQTSQVFSTVMDNQPSVEISVYQGEREFVKDDQLLGSFILVASQVLG
jgi:molecular chaperone DnaK (HSP70)